MSDAEHNGRHAQPLTPASYPITLRAPDMQTATAYDRVHLLTYARVLDAADAGADWREAASAILGCDDAAVAEVCWNSHLERARWIVGEGLIHLAGDSEAE